MIKIINKKDHESTQDYISRRLYSVSPFHEGKLDYEAGYRAWIKDNETVFRPEHASRLGGGDHVVEFLEGEAEELQPKYFPASDD